MQATNTKIYGHSSYIGTTGYNNHTRDFFRELSKIYEFKVRNFTVPVEWGGLEDEPFNEEYYLNDIDKKLLTTQTLIHSDPPLELVDHDIYSNYPNDFNHNLNIVLAEVNHHYFYQQYIGPKIAYTVWETTRYPKDFYNILNTFDQVWVPSKWQRECSIEQGMDPNKVKVVPEAVDGDTFYPDEKVSLPEYEDNRFKFIIFGRWDFRKSTKELIESFLQEFDKDEPVDLILSIDNLYANDGLKTTEERLEHYKLMDPRIKVKHFPTREEYIKYLQKGHVFLSCARSEGWNLPLIEAMACGTPSIYSECSAQLEFASGKGLPVRIKETTSAISGEYSTYSQSEMPGNFYVPDYEHLKETMRDAYENYDYHKKQALEESVLLRNKFTWKNAAQIAYNEVEDLMVNIPKNKIEISFDLGPKVEIKGSVNTEYFIEFIDGSTDKVLHSAVINTNMWTKCSKSYHIPWIIKINGEVVHNFNLEGKTVKISIDSKSLGDTLAWTPQVVEFKNKYKCKVIVSTFNNKWFEGLKAYKDITFVSPLSKNSSYAHFHIGWFKDENGNWDNNTHNPTQSNTIPLIQTATDILRLPLSPINHGISFTPKKRPIKDKYVCIGPEATAGLKEWPHSSWVHLASLLQSKGYKVISLSQRGFVGGKVINKTNLPFDELFNYIYHADLFIGLGSGLSWINWALGKHTLMINNFVPLGYDVPNNITKIENHDVCNNCWVSKEYTFDAGDWDWCPINKGTKDQHICQKSIKSKQVFKEALKILGLKKKLNFTWITGGDKAYLPMIEVLAKSLLKYSKHKLIVYSFNCNSDIDLPNVINKRIDYRPKPTYSNTHEPDLFGKDYSIYFAKYLASLDSLNEDYDSFAWIDGDAFATENIDISLQYLPGLKDYPLFMKYFHGDINQWRYHKGIKLEGKYGNELSEIKNIKRNPNNKLIATGFYFYDKKSKLFFEKCLEWNRELDNYSLKIYTDDNAFSEERVANNILWEENKTLDLPITWNNFYSSKDETLVSPYFLKKGFDVMYDKKTLQPYFIHGPDPSVKSKNAEVLNQAFNDYQLKKLMIVAHPDDELIFGGAELIKYGSEYKVICLTNKSNEIRSKEFKTVMEKLNVGSWEMFDYEDTLYPTQQFNLEDILMSRQWEKIVTHNPIGEYGHPQHKLVFDIVLNLTNDFYVFGKSLQKLDQNILDIKNNLLTLYTSEAPIINQLLTNNGDWFKSNCPFTNYIEHECIEKYDVNKNKDNYIKCYDK